MSDPKIPDAYRPRWVRRSRPAGPQPAARALAADRHHRRPIPRPPTVLPGDGGDRIEARPEGGSP